MFAYSDSPHSEPGTIDEVDHDNGTEPHTSDEGEWHKRSRPKTSQGPLLLTPANHRANLTAPQLSKQHSMSLSLSMLKERLYSCLGSQHRPT